MPRITVRTLKDELDGGYTLTASCETWRPGVTPCMHNAELDIAALIERFGPDFEDTKRLLAALICSKCGGKGVTVRLSPPSPHKMYRAAKVVDRGRRWIGRGGVGGAGR